MLRRCGLKELIAVLSNGHDATKCLFVAMALQGICNLPKSLFAMNSVRFNGWMTVVRCKG